MFFQCKYFVAKLLFISNFGRIPVIKFVEKFVYVDSFDFIGCIVAELLDKWLINR